VENVWFLEDYLQMFDDRPISLPSPCSYAAQPCMMHACHEHSAAHGFEQDSSADMSLPNDPHIWPVHLDPAYQGQEPAAQEVATHQQQVEQADEPDFGDGVSATWGGRR
jgi:hypothetical protein